MPRTSRAIADYVTPAFHAFLSDVVIPRGKVTEAVAGAVGITVADPRRPLVGKSSEARYLHKLLDEGIGRPSAAKAWQAADAAFSLGNEWCAGPLFLFASGHLDAFAYTIAAADESLVPRRRKAALVAAATTACMPTEERSANEVQQALRDAGLPETVIRAEIRNAASYAQLGLLPDRLAWILTTTERAAFRAAFLDRTVLVTHEYQVAFETCRLATLHPDLGVAMQRDIAVTCLWHAFSG